MKKLVLVLLLLFGVTAPVIAEPAPANVGKVDKEMRELVKRIYPAFVLIGGGSGVCISEDGYMLTNHHVFSDAVRPSSMVVYMAGNSRRFTAEAVGADTRGDIVLAKLTLKAGEKVPYVKLADSDKVQIGDLCVAIGNPFLLSGITTEPTVSLGTISACHRFQGGYSDCFQIDTAINPGNSGGPSFNLDGEIIGINGRMISNHGKRYNTGAGFAIASNQIRLFVDQMKQQPGGAHIVRHGLVDGLKVDLSAPGKGALVSGVDADTDAAAAGFKKGDVITAMDGLPVLNAYRYFGIVGAKPRGSTFEFTVRRGGENVTIHLANNVPCEAGQFGTIPRSDDIARSQDNDPRHPANRDPFALPQPRATLACNVKPSTEKTGGFIITSFTTDADGKESPLEDAGVAVDDVITAVNGRPIKYFCDFTDIMIALAPGTKVKVTVLQKGVAAELEVALGRRPGAAGRPR